MRIAGGEPTPHEVGHCLNPRSSVFHRPRHSVEVQETSFKLEDTTSRPRLNRSTSLVLASRASQYSDSAARPSGTPLPSGASCRGAGNRLQAAGGKRHANPGGKSPKADSGQAPNLARSRSPLAR